MKACPFGHIRLTAISRKSMKYDDMPNEAVPEPCPRDTPNLRSGYVAYREIYDMNTTSYGVFFMSFLASKTLRRRWGSTWA